MPARVAIPCAILLAMQRDGLLPDVLIASGLVALQTVGVTQEMVWWCRKRAFEIRRVHGLDAPDAIELDVLVHQNTYALNHLAESH